MASQETQGTGGGAAPLVGEALIARVVGLVNAARVQAGVPPLRASQELCQAARSHATDMAARNYFDYKSPDGTGGDIGSRITASGYLGKTGVDLNRGRATPEEAVESWLKSPATSMSLLRPDYRDLGIGAVRGFWTIVLGAPEYAATDEIRAEVRDRLSRVRLGVPPLELHPALSYAAQRHAFDLVTRKYNAEKSPDGLGVTDRVREAGYTGPASELRTVGHESAEAACAALFGDPASSPVLGNMAARYVGVGMYTGAWVVVLGVPENETVNTSESTGARTLELINAQRATAKLPPLRLSPLLMQAAAAQAADMAGAGVLSFDPPGKPGIAGHIKQVAYKGRFFPLVTKGQTQPDGVVQLAVGSAAHRSKLLDPEFRDLGAAVDKAHWVVLLGAPLAEASADVQGELVRLVNAQRAASSASALTLSPVLSGVAQAYAADMGQRNYFAFVNPEGVGLDTLAKRAGFTAPVVPALVRGYSTPEAALEAWMKSAQNRLNLLDPGFLHVGVGVSESRWVLILGSGDGTPAV